MKEDGRIPPPLHRAYEAAEVHIAVEGEWVPWEAFPLAPASRVHVVTAHNPGSVARPPPENRIGQLRLEEALTRRGYTFLPARNRAPEGGWEEAAFAVLDAPREAILALGRAFGQLAVYEIGKGGRRVLPCGGGGGDAPEGEAGSRPP